MLVELNRVELGRIEEELNDQLISKQLRDVLVEYLEIFNMSTACL